MTIELERSERTQLYGAVNLFVETEIYYRRS